MKKYLTERKKALLTDDYFKSDLAWMDMKDSKLDFVFGPIENYDDKLNSIKTSYEAFVLVKDEEESGKLSKFVKMLPQLQKELPCDPKYKNYVPGTSSDMNVYDVIFYGGDCNAGGKTIAINLPNDDKVQALKGSNSSLSPPSRTISTSMLSFGTLPSTRWVTAWASSRPSTARVPWMRR